MRPRVRLTLLAVAGAVCAAGLVLACFALPPAGRAHHPYGDAAVDAALRARHTASAVASVVFDQRAFDTLGEEMILFAAAAGALVLLRPAGDERSQGPGGGRVLPVTRRFGLVLLPVTVLVGVYVLAHGHLSPGGGFQGGVILATALHLLYVTADYRALERLRPLTPYQVGEAAGAAGFAVLGIAGVLTGAEFLTNVLPAGRTGALASGGTVPLLNVTVGLEVGCAVVVLLARFLDQAVEIRPAGGTAEGNNTR